MKYLVVGPAIVNDIQFTDQPEIKKVLGGSIYCLAGIKLWSDSCLFVSNVGSDFSEYYGTWMKDNKMSSHGLSYTLPRTWYTTLIYGEQGLHDEVSNYSDDIEALQSLNDVIDVEPIIRACSEETKGIYIEASESAPLWEHIAEIRDNTTAKILWELPTSATMDPKRKPIVLQTINTVDAYSINLPEACSLFGVTEEHEAIQAILHIGKPCFFRVGKRGSYFIENETAAFSPSVTVGPIVDPTGCGNVSTAAALYAWCEGFSAEKIAKIANISAAFNLLQYGPYPKVDTTTRQLALDLLHTDAP